MEFRPCDVAVIEGHKYNPMDWIIKQRTSTWWGHCAVIKNNSGDIFDPRTKGIEINHISKYNNRKFSIRRYNGLFDVQERLAWLIDKQRKSKPYDFLALVGFLTGKRGMGSENSWYCSELPYWMFQSFSTTRLTDEELSYIYPCFFMQSNDFISVGSNK